MNKKSKIFCFTHCDLDGAVSYMLFKWYFNKREIPYEATTAARFRDTFTSWLLKNNLEDYEKVFILDLDVSEHADLIDKDNVIIIDHHDSHLNNAEYKTAKHFIDDKAASASVLVYKFLSRLLPDIKLSQAQMRLIALSADYDSYALTVPESNDLNTVFWNTNKKFESFVTNFNNGFNGFTFEQQNIIKIHNQDVKETIDNLQVFAGDIPIGDKKRKVYACSANKNIDELAHYMLNKYSADVAIVINGEHVSFRKKKGTNPDLDLSELANTLGEDYGGGHSYAAGTTITETFLSFTKLLMPVDK